MLWLGGGLMTGAAVGDALPGTLQKVYVVMFPV